MPVLSVGDCIRYGWETFKQRPWLLIGAFLLTIIVPSIPGALFPWPEVPAGAPPESPGAAALLASFAGAVLGIFAALGATTLALRAHDNIAQAEFADLWNPRPFWSFLGAHILLAVIVLFGIMLLIVPGVIAAVGLCLAPYLVIDRGSGPIEAIQGSWQLTKGHKWQLFGLVLALIGLNLLGALALIVGLLVTIPVTWIAVAHAYRTLSASSQ